ncbi:MAG: hypothetical protein COX70_00205 [Flavobacteriales bacterium CG_4_10_14_0_2_um_filter_32_8]|nr:MAG: hypothetical protein COX70_00205 [Flavobacteriales bacterium CG_4_10_14_0_2_um_filter_32_8]PJB15244.1 MAG: hypothetical protein CO118_04405 [Flavobacteriales bacterium CG_4_9_14_3_um_filter_32_8]
MNFEDPTLMREKLTYDICNEMGLFSLRTAFTKVYINNVYWGVNRQSRPTRLTNESRLYHYRR